LIVVFSFLIEFITQDQGLRARTMLPCLGCDICALVFSIPDRTNVYLMGKLCSLRYRNLLICNCRCWLWRVWSKGKGPRIFRIKPCPWHKIQSKCVSCFRMCFSL